MAKTATRERTTLDQQQQQPGPAPQGNVPAKAGEKQVHPLVAFKAYMDERMASLIQALPPHITPNVFTSVVLTALQRKPELLKCTRQSLWNACILAAQDGLLPDGREGAIAPYGENKDGKRVAEIATWMPMVEGYRKKARNSGEIAKWEVNLVRARDLFKVTLGDRAEIIHEPYFGPEENTTIVGAYSIATLRDGSVMRDVMTIREIQTIRAKSKAKNGPWSDATFFPEMCRKTMARRHYKQLPHSSEMDRMVERDDEAFGLDDPNSAQAVADRNERQAVSTRTAFDQFAGNGMVIENDEPTGEQDDENEQIDGDDEFGEETDQREPEPEPRPATQRAPAKPADRAAPKPDPISSGPQGEPAKAPPKTNAATTKPADPEPNSDQIEDGAGSDDGDVEQNDRRWPPGQTPSNAQEYASYVKTRLEDWSNKTAFDTGTMEVIGADGISSWWKSKAERDLRNACGVQEAAFHELLAACRARAEAIRKGK